MKIYFGIKWSLIIVSQGFKSVNLSLIKSLYHSKNFLFYLEILRYFSVPLESNCDLAYYLPTSFKRFFEITDLCYFLN